MKINIALIVLVWSIFSFKVEAQLFIDTSYTIDEMVTDFFNNSCVTPSNISTTGIAASVAFFDAGNTSLGVPAGIFISTGDVFDAIGPNNSPGTGLFMNIPGDPDLNNLLGITTYDAVTIEMDIVATESLLEFSYVFASEEYPEFVGSSFNDGFAFFISGPGISGLQNIAMIPGTTQPVSINNINSNSNSNLYVDNAGGQEIEFDGFTTQMIAQQQVTPNAVYQVKIVIGDAGDGVYDSGIFLGIESLCGGSTVPLTNNSNVTLEGNTITFENDTKYASAHSWDFGDGNTSTEKTPSPHTYGEDGLYEVKLITSNFCCSDTSSFAVQVGKVTSLLNPAERPYSVSPNPVKDFTSLNFRNGEAFMVRIYNSNGKRLNTERGVGQSTISFQDLPTGLYILEIQWNNIFYVEKLVKH